MLSLCHFSFVKKCKFRQKFCHKSEFRQFRQISSKINIFVTTASFRHFVSFSSKTKSFGAYLFVSWSAFLHTESQVWIAWGFPVSCDKRRRVNRVACFLAPSVRRRKLAVSSFLIAGIAQLVGHGPHGWARLCGTPDSLLTTHGLLLRIGLHGGRYDPQPVTRSSSEWVSEW